MGEKPSKEIQEQAPIIKTFDYAEKRLSHYNSIVITQNRYSRNENIDSIIETTIEGKRCIILQSNLLIHQHLMIYLDEQFNYIKERLTPLSNSFSAQYDGQIRRRMILDQNRILIDTIKGLHFQYDHLSQLLSLSPFTRIDYYRVLGDGSFQTLTNIKTTEKETDFDLVDFKRKASFAGITADARHVPFNVTNVPENLFFVNDLEICILACYELDNLLVMYVKYDDKNKIYHVIVSDVFKCVGVDIWFLTDKWTRQRQFSVKDDEFYRLNIYFNEKSIKYQGNKMQFASLVPEVYSDWRKDALKLLSETECLNKFSLSLLAIVVDFVAC